MKCPYCSNEMELGMIRSSHEIAWLKGDKPHTFTKASFHEGSVVLAGLDLMKGSTVTAFLCRACRKVIIDYANK